MKSNKERTIADFIDCLMEEKSPDYKEIKGDLNLLSIADIALLLKKGDETPDKNFQKSLEDRLLAQLTKEKIVNKELKKLRRESFTRFAIGFTSILLIMAGIAGLKTPNTSMMFPRTTAKKDIVRLEEKRIAGKTVQILYNKENYAILYWPLGQFKMLQ